MEKLNLFKKIKLKIFWDNNIFYILIKLNISKIFFIFSAFFYFLMYLFVLWWFKLEITSKILFFIYPIFIFSTLIMLYNIIMMFIIINFEKLLILKYFIWIIIFFIYIFIILTHLWFQFNFLINFYEKIF